MRTSSSSPGWGRPALETVDTLILAGIADTRGDAIGRALDRVREQPAYERLREHVLDTRRLIDEWVDGAILIGLPGELRGGG